MYGSILAAEDKIRINPFFVTLTERFVVNVHRGCMSFAIQRIIKRLWRLIRNTVFSDDFAGGVSETVGRVCVCVRRVVGTCGGRGDHNSVVGKD